MKKQPGVMLYFEIRPCLERLTMDEQGQLFNAILAYGEDGIEPNFDYMLGIAWDFIKPRLDRDRERYAEISQKRAEAAQARWEAYYANADCEEQTLPTTSTTAAPTVTPTVTPTANTLSQASSTPPGFVREIVENLPQKTDFP